VDALVRLMQTTVASGEIFNIGSNHEVTIGALARRVRELTGSASDVIRLPYRTAYGEGFADMHRRIPALSRLTGAIGFEPTTSLDGIIESVIAYELDRADAARRQSPTA